MQQKSSLEQVMQARRNFIKAALAAGIGGAAGLGSGAAFGAAPEPWAVRPKGDPKSVNFIVWQFGKIYEQISQQFEKDWGVKVDAIIEPNIEPQVAKLMSMYAAGSDIDVFNAPMQYIANEIDQGVAAPLDGLPGLDEYLKDMTPLARKIITRNGKTWGLPYLSMAWCFIYNDELLTKAGFGGKPFGSWDELVEQCRKAKKDGVSEYPLLWAAGAAFDPLPGTWISQVANRGGRIFGPDMKPELGPGSVARETLRYFQDTFLKHKIADPESLTLKYVPAVKVFNTGKHIYTGAMHNYYMNLVNDPAQSPIAGKAKILGMPGDGRTIAVTWYYMLSAVTKNREWAWKMLQYLGGRTKNGEYTQAINLAKDAMLMPGYKSVLQNPAVRETWAKRVDVDKMLGIFDKAASMADVVPAIFEPWYPKWNEMLNVELTACLRGQISPDVACDNMIANVKKAKA